MKELKKHFDIKKYKMSFAQMVKSKDVVIYKVSQPHADGDGHSEWYEVFRYKTSGMNPMDVNYDPDETVEIYPSDEAFGLWAWSCSNLGVVEKVLNAKFAFSKDEISDFLTSCGQL